MNPKNSQINKLYNKLAHTDVDVLLDAALEAADALEATPRGARARRIARIASSAASLAYNEAWATTYEERAKLVLESVDWAIYRRFR